MQYIGGVGIITIIKYLKTELEYILYCLISPEKMESDYDQFVMKSELEDYKTQCTLLTMHVKHLERQNLEQREQLRKLALENSNMQRRKKPETIGKWKFYHTHKNEYKNEDTKDVVLPWHAIKKMTDERFLDENSLSTK